MNPPLPGSSDPSSGEAWREAVLTRMGWVLFLAGGALQAYFILNVHLGRFHLAASLMPPIAGAFTALTAGRVALNTRGSIMVGVLLFTGGTFARLSGPSPGMFSYLILAAVLATLVFGLRAGFVVVVAGAACVLFLGSAGRVRAAAIWAEEVPQLATWIRMTMTFSILTGLLVTLVGDTVLRVERQAAERLGVLDELRASEERYRLLFNGNPMPMFLFDPQTTRLLGANEAAVRQYGYSRQELMAMSVGDLALPGDPHYQTFLAGLGRPRPPIVHVGPRQQRRWDGSIVDVDLTSLEVPFEGRTVRMTLARDVTAEHEAAAQVAELQDSLRRSETMAAMGSLVAGVAHELRNPLFSISATLDALEAEYGSQPGYAEYAALLRSQVTRLGNLSRDLLDFGKSPVLRRAEGRPDQLVRLAVRSCALVAREHGVAVIDDVSPALPRLMVDTGRIQQVIENLVANAIQHSARGATVHVRAEQAGEGATQVVRFRVEDEGAGVPEADLPRLFEPFFSRRKGGTGLGLSIVQRIVEAHGGAVRVENRRPGAAFVVTLPAGGAEPRAT